MPIYVQHEVLGRIPDVFNAEAIWHAPGLALFARRPLLRDLLERCPRELRGRTATRCFSHVTLTLPQEEVDDDYHLTRGARARELAETLTALHQKDFGDLLGADQVRYGVVGAEALAPGQIEVRFGHAVYLPAPEEKILYNVSVSRDSAIWQPVCPIYPDQRLALVGGDAGAASCAGWPFAAHCPQGAILIVNDGPGAPPTVQMRPKDAFDCRFDPRTGYYTIQPAHGGAEPAANGVRLLLRITRVAPGVARKPAVWQGRGAAPSPAGAGADLTALPVSHQPAPALEASDATYVPSARQRVSLVALALPRLSRYLDTGASALELPFDRTLALGEGSARSLSIVVTAADELYACTSEGRRRITAPASFAPVDARTIALLAPPPPMAERYCATVCLPHPLGVDVTGGARLQFGRGSAALAALRLLDTPRYLQRTGGAEPASADRLGLSRQAFSFEAAARGFKIARLAATQALYHLDQQLAYVDSVEAGVDAPYWLPSGHHLVAGNYVLRFDA